MLANHNTLSTTRRTPPRLFAFDVVVRRVVCEEIPRARGRAAGETVIV